MKILVLALLSAASLAAQPRHDFFAWWDSPMARDLKLTEDQKSKIQATVREYRSRLIDLRAGLEKAEADFGDLFNEDRPDARKANETIDKLATARSELTRTFSQMSLKLRSALTPEQWRELQRRRHPGPGMGGQQGPRGPQGPGGIPGGPRGPRPGRSPGGPPMPPQPPQPPAPPQPPLDLDGSSY